MVHELAGLAAPIFVAGGVRTMTADDARVVRECENRDALLALRSVLATARIPRARRLVAYLTLAMCAVVALLMVLDAPTTSLLAATGVLVGLVVAVLIMQRRGRARALAIVGWLGAVNLRLSQLAARR